MLDSVRNDVAQANANSERQKLFGRQNDKKFCSAVLDQLFASKKLLFFFIKLNRGKYLCSIFVQNQI